MALDEDSPGIKGVENFLKIAEFKFLFNPDAECDCLVFIAQDGEKYIVNWNKRDCDFLIHIRWEHEKTALVTMDFRRENNPWFTPRGANVVQAIEMGFHLRNEFYLDQNLTDKFLCNFSVIKYTELESFRSLTDAKSSVSSNISEQAVSSTELETRQYMLFGLSVDLCGIFLRSDMTDITITNGQRDLKVHKIILSARSPVFQRMLLDNSPKIYIPGISNETLENLAVFMYSGAAKIVNVRMTRNLYKVAVEYKIESLRDMCSAYLSNVNLKNIKKTLILADEHGDTALKNCALNLIFKNIVTPSGKKLMDSLAREGKQGLIDDISNFSGGNPSVEEFMLSLSTKCLVASN